MPSLIEFKILFRENKRSLPPTVGSTSEDLEIVIVSLPRNRTVLNAQSDVATSGGLVVLAISKMTFLGGLVDLMKTAANRWS